jgi:hypothetical protein
MGKHGNRPDHAVVFVHGMGRALKGGTLQEWAQPPMLSLHDLSLDLVPEDVPSPHLVITKANAVGDAPEVWVNVLRGYADGRPDYLTVLMTEASWGRDFEPASAASTYSWALRTALRVYKRSVQLIKWNLYPGSRRTGPAWFGAWLRQRVLTSLAAFAGLFILLAVLVVLVLALWALCFTRTSISGLPARTGEPGAPAPPAPVARLQPTASGSLPVNTVTAAADQRSRSGS